MQALTREVLQESFNFWQQAQKDCEDCLAELLGNEFKDVKTTIEIVLDFSKPDWNAIIDREFIFQGYVFIRINAHAWLVCTDYVRRGLLRGTIAHEVLHVASPLLKHGPEYDAELVRRGFEPSYISNKKYVYGPDWDRLYNSNKIKKENK